MEEREGRRANPKHADPAGVEGKKDDAMTSDATPDYSERLAFGTDQGRWLNAQMGERSGSKSTHKRTSSGGRAFHDLDSMAPDPNAAQTSALLVDSRLQRLSSRCQETIPPLFGGKTVRLSAGAVGVFMMLFFLTRFV